MPISQTTITGSFKTPDNKETGVTKVKFTLNNSDFEAGEIISTQVVEADVDPQTGDFRASVWPNDRGSKGGTNYKIEFITGVKNEKITGLESAYIRHSDTEKTLEDIFIENQDLGKGSANNLIILTQSEYDALNPKTPKTVYLVKA